MFLSVFLVFTLFSGCARLEYKIQHAKSSQALARGDYEDAIRFTNQSLQIARKELGEKHPETLTQYHNLVVTYRLYGRYIEAEKYFLLALNGRKEVLGAEAPPIRVTMSQLGRLYEEKGHYQQAQDMLVKTLEIQQRLLGSDHESTLKTMTRLGSLYSNLDANDKAMSLHVRALGLKMKKYGEFHKETATTLLALANVYYDQTKYKKSEKLIKQAIAVYTQLLSDEHPYTLSAMSDLASFYSNMGDYSHAQELSLNVLKIRKTKLSQNHPDVFSSINQLGHIYLAQGRYEKARYFYKKALDGFEKHLGIEHPRTLAVMNNLAIIAYEKGEYERAELLYTQVINSLKKILPENHRLTLTSMGNLAELYGMTSRLTEALNLQRTVFDIRTRTIGATHPQTLLAKNNVAKYQFFLGRPKQAISIVEEVLQQRKKTLGASHPETLRSQSDLALMHFSRKHWDKAFVLLKEHLHMSNRFLDQALWAAGEKTRQSYLQLEQGTRNLYYTVFSARKDQRALREFWNVSITRKGLLLSIASKLKTLARQQNTHPKVKKVLIEYNQLRKELAGLIFSDGKLQQRLALQESIHNLERRLGSLTQPFRKHNKSVVQEQIISALKDGEGLVDFVIFKEVDPQTFEDKGLRAVAVVVTPNREISLVELDDVFVIEQFVASYRSAIEPTAMNLSYTEKRTKSLTNAAKNLYRTLWKPLEQHLKGIKQVFIVPDGILHLIPFKALQNSDGKYLLDIINVMRLSSAKDLVENRSGTNTMDSIIFSNPEYDVKMAQQVNNSITNARNLRGLRFDDLPGTKIEGEHVRNSLTADQQKVALYSGERATETAFMRLRSPRILHLATHGFFLANVEIPTKNYFKSSIKAVDGGKFGVAHI